MGYLDSMYMNLFTEEKWYQKRMMKLNLMIEGLETPKLTGFLWMSPRFDPRYA